MLNKACMAFVKRLKKSLLSESNVHNSAESDQYIRIKKAENQYVNLDLTPFDAEPAEANAQQYFSNIHSTGDLINACQSAKQSLPFESHSKELMQHVSAYAQEFIDTLFQQALLRVSDEHAQLIAGFVKALDIYTAVKAVESLLYSQADLKLLEVVKKNAWSIHFDHLAIRCGNQDTQDAERVVNLLKTQHGYVSTLNKQEAYYQFSDGWNAYPLYKILNNGQVIRLFIDQSDANAPTQIIQHWNHIYGYTAHHLAIRVCKLGSEGRHAVQLSELMTALRAEGVEVMTPTGEYTLGLLQQVFTRPEKDKNIPQILLENVKQYGESLEQTIANAKLLEVVSRREMDPALRNAYFNLYGLQYDPSNHLHSAPIYQYFLPAQAAHVIKTSMET